MTRDVTVQELGEHLVERLEEARTGTTIQVVSEGKTIARIEPPYYPDVATFAYPEPRETIHPREGEFRPPRLKWDPVELLHIDRGEMREFATFPDPSFGPLGEWTPPSLHLDWDPVEDLVAERDRNR
jgi:antitoxin (DNA-binding transcriptional repressor) of toxin-antitoxin stability system